MDVIRDFVLSKAEEVSGDIFNLKIRARLIYYIPEYDKMITSKPISLYYSGQYENPVNSDMYMTYFEFDEDSTNEFRNTLFNASNRHLNVYVTIKITEDE